MKAGIHYILIWNKKATLWTHPFVQCGELYLNWNYTSSWQNMVPVNTTIYFEGTRYEYWKSFVFAENLDEVIKLVVDHMTFLRMFPPSEAFFNSLRTIHNGMFKNKQKISAFDYTQYLSAEMLNPVPREWILSEGPLEWIYDPKLIQDIANMFTIKNCFVIYSSHDDFPDNSIVKTEQYFKIQYSVSPFSNKLVRVSWEYFQWPTHLFTEL